jgi:hypothetical protein
MSPAVAARFMVKGTGAAAYQGIGDIVPTGWGSWCGLRAFSNAVIGANCCRLRRASDSLEQDFTTVAGGGVDISGITTFLASTTGWFRTFYDQAGLGNHWQQTTSALQPQCVLSVVGSKPALLFISASATSIISQSVFSVSVQPWSWQAVARRTANFTTVQVLLNVNTNPDQLGWDSVANTLRFYAGTMVTGVAAADSTWHGLVATMNGAASNLQVDSTANSGNAGADSMGALIQYAGDYSGGGFPVDGNAMEWGVYAGDLSASAAAINAQAKAFYGY